MRVRARLGCLLSTVLLGGTLSVVPTALAPSVAHAVDVVDEGSLREYELHDTFTGAINKSPHYGLNSRLANRQKESAAPVGYSRKTGYYAPGTPGLSATQVNHVSTPGTLSFHLPASSPVPTSAVRLDAPLPPSAQGLKVRATLSPLLRDDLGAAENAWTSLMLTQDESNGWVAGNDIELGLLMRSSGRVEVYQRGTQLKPDGLETLYYDVTRAASYDVELTVAATSALVIVNGVSFRVTVTQQTDRRHHLLVGSYFGPLLTPAMNPVSTVDDLKVWRVAALQHFGHYFTSWCLHPDPCNHIPEVASQSTLHYVEEASDLQYCEDRQCVLQTRFTFFPSEGRTLDPDWRNRWQNLVDAIGPNHTKIAAFYAIDEPFWHPKLHKAGYYPHPDDFQTSLTTIRSTYTNIPIMAVFNRSIFFQGTCPDGTSRTVVLDCFGSMSPTLDWVGFASYDADDDPTIGRVEIAPLLRSRMGVRQRMFLVPQGHTESDTNKLADEALAPLQHTYLAFADQLNDAYAADPELRGPVIGLLTFGRFTNNYIRSTEPWTFVPTPITSGEQYCIGKGVLDRQTIAFHDSFDDADNTSAYGLNSANTARQCRSTWSATATTTYTRKSGFYGTSTPPSAWYNQVNQLSYKDRMSFHVGPSAVMASTPVSAGPEGLRITAAMSPLVNDDLDAVASTTSWMSLMLSDVTTSNGWINDIGIDLGIMIRSSGRVQLVRNDTPIYPTGSTLPYYDVPRAATYHVDVTLDGTSLVVTVNGVDIRATTTAITAPAYVYVGNYFPTPTTGLVSTIDELMVSTRKA